MRGWIVPKLKLGPDPVQGIAKKGEINQKTERRVPKRMPQSGWLGRRRREWINDPKKEVIEE